MPDRPLLFLKPPSAIVGPGEPIILPQASSQVEYEGEIAVVIGQRLSRADAARGAQAIGGFTCLNDVTARDLQRTDGQWTRAKGFDTFCPVGPAVVEGLDWRELEVVTRLNGTERQRGRSAEMHFAIPDLLAYISHIMTLEVGDLVATGTPAGVGALTAGDIVEIEVSGVGCLTNPVAGDES